MVKHPLTKKLIPLYRTFHSIFLFYKSNEDFGWHSLDNQSKSGEQAAVENSQEYDSDSTLFFRRIHLICLPRRIFGMGILGQLRGPIDFDRQCGAINVRNLPCSRSLACKVHSLDRKRAVQGRSKPYDELWLEWNGAINSRWADQQEPKRGGIMKRRRVPC